MFTDSVWFTWVIIPILIFLARVTDVSLGTVRIVFVSKGYKFLAPLLGFFEVLIWLIAMSKVFENLNNWLYYIAYAGGFATGNYVGLLLEERLALGYINLKIVTQLSGRDLIKRLSAENYGVTWTEANGSRGKVNVIHCVIKRSSFNAVANLINEYNPRAFYTIDDIRFAREGVFPPSARRVLNGAFPRRKGK